jgi:hypothetical protein
MVSLGKSMLVNEMEAALLSSGALSIAIFDEAGVCLLTFILKLLTKGVVMLVYVKGKKVGRGEILATGGTSVEMFLCIVKFESFNGREINRIAVRR